LKDFIAALQDSFQELSTLAQKTGPAPGRAPRRSAGRNAPDGAIA
jgi:hypothetical protein